jgi:hypothetical protein
MIAVEPTLLHLILEKMFDGDMPLVWSRHGNADSAAIT